MDSHGAIDALGSLAQGTRLEIYRLLVREEPDGLSAGDISRRLEIVASTLSGHLGILKRAGMLNSVRRRREIYYTANLDAMGDLVRFMLADCCQGQVENCGDVMSLVAKSG